MYEAKRPVKTVWKRIRKAMIPYRDAVWIWRRTCVMPRWKRYRKFEVYYQPIIDIQGGKDVCAGAEALIRWNSAKLGFISPAEFIPLAEYLGLINPIGNYVLTEACTRCKHWNDTGYPDYKVNVNLSVVQLLPAGHRGDGGKGACGHRLIAEESDTGGNRESRDQRYGSYERDIEPDQGTGCLTGTG